MAKKQAVRDEEKPIYEEKPLEQLRITVQPGTRFYLNARHLIKLDKANPTWMSRWHKLLGHIYRLGDGGRISTVPAVKRLKPADAGKNNIVANSAYTGRGLRWAYPITYTGFEGRKNLGEVDYAHVSRDDYGDLIATFSILGQPQKMFRRSVEQRPKSRKRADDLKALESILASFEGLPAHLQEVFGDIIDSDPESVYEFLRYAKELTAGEKEGVRRKRDAGNIVNALYRRIQNDDIPVAEGYVALTRIMNPRFEASRDDWVAVIAMAAQLLPEKTMLFRRMTDDIRYAMEHKKELGYKVEPDMKVTPKRWWREIPQVAEKGKRTVEQILKSKYTTRAEIQGMREALSGLWQARRNYMQATISEYFTEEQLAEAAEKLHKAVKHDGVFDDERREYVQREDNPMLSPRGFKVAEGFLRAISYFRIEAKGHERRIMIREALIDNMTMEECKSYIPKIYAEAQKLDAGKSREKVVPIGSIFGV